MPFDQILTFLSRLLPGLRRSRQKTLAWLILGFLQGSDWPEKRTLSALIRAIPRMVSFEAKKKQFYRFLANPAFNLTALNRTLWLGLTRRLPQNSVMAVTLDWVTKSRWALLGAALPSPAGRALVFAQVLVKRTDLKLTQNRIEAAFIRFLGNLFERANRPDVRFVLVADRGFAKSSLISRVLGRVEFIIRTPERLGFTRILAPGPFCSGR